MFQDEPPDDDRDLRRIRGARDQRGEVIVGSNEARNFPRKYTKI